MCHVSRLSSHRVFRRIAKRAKTLAGCFFGFKLHLIINDQGESLVFKLTPGNTDDRKRILDLTKDLCDKDFGDEGYLSIKLFEELRRKSVQLITKQSGYQI